MNSPALVLTGHPLRNLVEAAEVRAQRELGFGPNGRIVRRSEMDGENGDINLKVQVQIEQAVMVDYDVKTKRKSKQDV